MAEEKLELMAEEKLELMAEEKLSAKARPARPVLQPM